MKKYFALLLVSGILTCDAATAQNKARFGDIKRGMDGEPQLEQQALKIANERAVNMRCHEEYTQAKIISINWEMEYDKDGFVSGRRIHMELYCEKPDGCGMADFTFRQKHEQDGIFSRKLLFYKVGYMYNVACE